MEQIRYTVILDITDNGCFNTGWRLKQGDGQNIVLDVKVTNNAENYVAENPPRIVFKRPDGYSVIGQMDASGEDFYTYTIVGNEIAVAGNVLMDVKFGEDEDRTSTASCKFEVIPDTIGQSSGGSDIYNNTLAELVEISRVNVLLAESYTKGGTGIRSGEETDNARYYKDKAAETVDNVMREYLIENVDYLKNQNRFNPSKVTNGKINIENGNIISDSNYITSDYIPFDLTKLNNDRVKFGASSYGGDDLIVQLYDNQKRNIRTLFYGSLGISWIGTNFMEEVSIPENDVLRYDLVYVRYSLQKDSINPILGNRALFDYSTFGDYKSNKVLSEDLTQIYDGGFASKNKLMGIENGSINDLGADGSSTARARSIGYIEVEPNTDYTFSHINLGGKTVRTIIREFSAPNTQKISDNGWSDLLEKPFTTSANTHYIRLIFAISDGSEYPERYIGNAQLEKGSATPYTPFAKPNTELTQIVDDAIERGFYSNNLWQINPITIGANAGATYAIPLKKGKYIFKTPSSFGNGNFNFFGVETSNEALISGGTWENASRGIPFEATKDYGSLRIYTNIAISGNIQIIKQDDTDTSYHDYVPSNIELKNSLAQINKVIDYPNQSTSIPTVPSGFSNLLTYTFPEDGYYLVNAQLNGSTGGVNTRLALIIDGKTVADGQAFIGYFGYGASKVVKGTKGSTVNLVRLYSSAEFSNNTVAQFISIIKLV